MTLYIIYNELNSKYYIGITNNLERRIIEHNRENSHYTGKVSGTWNVKFFKEYKTKEEAYKEEKRLKNAKNRKYLEWYINNSGR